ncbi:hypothetical protein AAFF_G00191040 [Aldrovandia affinis]|uniref:Uncharacterized protein n=1 Tax=Aldrovandia affinis TaxID=143900 RepID=A0AAD7W656_9TELE|nr:hypothetical protein AAFF_G00191040 [Aldrovandia affinis]
MAGACQDLYRYGVSKRKVRRTQRLRSGTPRADPELPRKAAGTARERARGYGPQINRRSAPLSEVWPSDARTRLQRSAPNDGSLPVPCSASQSAPV